VPALVAGEAEFTNTVSPDVITIDLRDGAERRDRRLRGEPERHLVTARPLTTREELRKALGRARRGDADHCTIAMAFERWGWDLDADARIVPWGRAAKLDLLLDPANGRVIMHSPEPFQAASAVGIS